MKAAMTVFITAGRGTEPSRTCHVPYIPHLQTIYPGELTRPAKMLELLLALLELLQNLTIDVVESVEFKKRSSSDAVHSAVTSQSQRSSAHHR
jgi:hypothetical protein